ncbi:hypothetical protein U8V72_11750 [Priestia filamentosa]|uniref:hypothetical protein n=1 Tax=Priestia filamentosa TaxID=1402861 RepID=UPI00058914E1
MNQTLVKSIIKVRSQKARRGFLHKLKLYLAQKTLKAKPSEPYIIKANSNDTVDMRQNEISVFLKQLYEFGFDFTSLTSKKPRQEQEIETSYLVAETISTSKELSEKMLSAKALPLADITNILSVKKNFLVKNEAYITALTLLLIGNYKLIKEYLVEEKT